MKFVALVTAVAVLAVERAAAATPNRFSKVDPVFTSASTNSGGVGHRQLPISHFIDTVKPVTQEAYSAAIVARGGGMDLRNNKGLWAALAFNAFGAVSAAFKPELITSHLMTFSVGAAAWPGHFLAIMWAGAACHTFLSLQHGSGAAVDVSRKANIVTTGLSCLLGVWQYSHGVYDHQHTLGFIAITGAITAALVKTEHDKVL